MTGTSRRPERRRERARGRTRRLAPLLAGCAAALLAVGAAARPLAAQADALPLAGGLEARRAPVPAVIRRGGPGRPGRLLSDALDGAHDLLVVPPGDSLVIPRDVVIPRTLVVLGGPVILEGRVAGSTVVIGAGLFVHPEAVVAGDAVAIGGGVYESSLARIDGEVVFFLDETFDVRREGDVLALYYRDLIDSGPPTFALPFYGIGIPTYTRVDGLALPWGPTITLRDEALTIAPRLVWRTDLGTVDPAVAAEWRYAPDWRLLATAARGTFTNDAWIRGDLVNSITTLIAGVDTRNYFRADRAQVLAQRELERGRVTLSHSAGARWERAWSVGPDSTATSAPWTVFNRDDPLRILRPNPPVDAGQIASLLAGGRLAVDREDLSVVAGVLAEQAVVSPADGAFTQLTGDVEVAFPTFRTQWFEVHLHAVGTLGDAPRQRYAYLGGNGTILTLPLLSLGGDRLLYADSRYHIPIDAVRIPIVGPPMLTLRHMIGSAGVGDFPTFVQNLGVRLNVAVLRFDYTIDPESRVSDFDISFTFPAFR